MCTESGGYRRDHLRALAQRVEVVDPTEIRIMGSKTELLRTLVVAASVESAGLQAFAVLHRVARHGR
jgi:site-specific DNA recombinase